MFRVCRIHRVYRVSWLYSLYRVCKRFGVSGSIGSRV